MQSAANRAKEKVIGRRRAIPQSVLRRERRAVNSGSGTPIRIGKALAGVAPNKPIEDKRKHVPQTGGSSGRAVKGDGC